MPMNHYPWDVGEAVILSSIQVDESHTCFLVKPLDLPLSLLSVRSDLVRCGRQGHHCTSSHSFL